MSFRFISGWIVLALLAASPLQASPVKSRLPAAVVKRVDPEKGQTRQGKRANQLLKSALADQGASASAKKAQRELKKFLKFDDLNWSYFWSLYQSRMRTAVDERVRIFEPGASVDPGTLLAYPTAIATGEMMSHLPYVHHAALRENSDYVKVARTAELWVKKMQAGTGSSMTRTTYLAKLLNIPESEVRIGAKGMNLYVVGNETRPITLVEVQLLQAIHDAKEGHFAKISLHDIVSSETADSVRELWNKPSLTDPSKTYAQLIAENPHLGRTGQSVQSYMPNLVTETNALTYARTAPGGHSLFAVEALRAAYLDAERPKAQGRPLVSVIGNGEDLSTMPDPAMVGWMIQEKIPIVMVTTEKTENDIKGGQIALIEKPGAMGDPEIFATIIETVQAKKAGQVALFELLGIRPGDQMAFFNTNMALFNYEVLVPKIKALVAEIGESEFMKIITPDPIGSPKEGFTQLEGTMGSTLLNLDRFWRRHYGSPLVHFVNVEKKERTKFFSPIKSAFDFFMQFHSDRFSLNRKTWRLTNHRPGLLPSVTLSDKYYVDVQNVLDAFGGVKILDLEWLNIEGQVSLPGVTLKKAVRIINRRGAKVNLAELLRAKGLPLVLENKSVEIEENGGLKIIEDVTR